MCHKAYTSPPYIIIISLTSFLLDDKPTLGKLQVLRSHGRNKVHIIKRLAPHWTVVGDLLEFDGSGMQLSIIEKEHSGAPETCCRAMFQHWLGGNGVKPCSWCTLVELLRDCDQEDLSQLAEEIEAALST